MVHMYICFFSDSQILGQAFLNQVFLNLDPPCRIYKATRLYTRHCPHIPCMVLGLVSVVQASSLQRMVVCLVDSFPV